MRKYLTYLLRGAIVVMIPIAAYVPSVCSRPFTLVYLLTTPTLEYFIGNFFVLGHFSGVWLGPKLGCPIAKRESENRDSPDTVGQFTAL